MAQLCGDETMRKMSGVVFPAPPGQWPMALKFWQKSIWLPSPLEGERGD